MKYYRIMMPLAIAIAVGVVLVCMHLDFVLACLFRSYDDIDIHSADTRHRTYVLFVQTSNDIQQSLLSVEASRLGIGIPVPRVWKLANAKYFRRHGDCKYGILLKSGDTLVEALVRAGTADDERRIVVNEFLVSLRTESPHEVYKCLCGLLERVNTRQERITPGNRGRSPIRGK